MRIIKEKFLIEQQSEFPQAATWLKSFRLLVRAAHWNNIHDVRKLYPAADAVIVKSGRAVTLFNVCGNKYRLIVAIHYPIKIIYTLKFMTHALYSKNKWKDDL